MGPTNPSGCGCPRKGWKWWLAGCELSRHVETLGWQEVQYHQFWNRLDEDNKQLVRRKRISYQFRTLNACNYQPQLVYMSIGLLYSEFLSRCLRASFDPNVTWAFNLQQPGKLRFSLIVLLHLHWSLWIIAQSAYESHSTPHPKNTNFANLS